MAVGCLLALVGPLSGRTAAQEPERLKVVATFSILGDVVRNVGGDAIDLTVIVGAGGDAHTFEPWPKPDQVAVLADADLIFENGLGFEHGWTTCTRPQGRRPHGSWSQTGCQSWISTQPPGRKRQRAPGTTRASMTRMFWQDVSNVIGEVTTIRDALAAADPANAAACQARAEYTRELQALDAAIRTQVNGCQSNAGYSSPRTTLAGYFARAYGFTIAGTALGSLSTEAADPSAGEIAALRPDQGGSGVPAIFAENVENKISWSGSRRTPGSSWRPSCIRMRSARATDRPPRMSP